MELLVVPPLYFDVVESYNTRMRPDHPHGKPDKRKAIEQWSRMITALRHDLGVNIYFIDPAEGLHDMAFACDPGLWINDFFIASNFQVSQRQPEVKIFEAWFEDHGHEIIRLPEGAYFEGGDCVMVGSTALIGYGDSRTNTKGVQELAAILGERGIKVVPLRRVTKEFYHLNSVLTHYPTPNLVVYYRAAFENAAWEILRRELPDATIDVLVDLDVMRHHPEFGGEYLYSYCLNSIENNGKVIQPYCSSVHRNRLKLGGNLEIVIPEGGSSEFERSGGSYRCLTMIHNLP